MSKHRKIWTPDEKLEVLNYRKEHGLANASREYGVSSVSILNWEKKFLENGNQGLERGSKTAIE